MTSSLWTNIRRSRTPATFALLAIIAVVFAAQFLIGDSVTIALAFYGPLIATEPWRVLTSAVAHSGIMHVMFNGYSLWLFGDIVERLMGTARFMVIVVSAAVMGCLAIVVLNPQSVVIGASSIVFGLFAAVLVLNRGLGGSNVSLLVIVGINLALGFIIPGVSWQAHLGGLAGGAIATALIRRFRRR